VMRCLIIAAILLAPIPCFAGTYALVDSTDTVQNIIVWDGVSQYTPPPGEVTVPLTSGAGIGWTYANGTFTAPPPVAQ
jgi:hypothetical protein